MSYSAQTFVAGEQPTTTKWNILWSNDASFNDGSGIQPTGPVTAGSGDLDLRGATNKQVLLGLSTQTDNNNSIVSAQTNSVRIQAGWGQKVGGGAANLTDSVTFPVAFNTVLGVIASPLGAKNTSAATSITDLNVSYTTVIASVPAESITTSGFTANLVRGSGTFQATIFYGYSWLAWGT